MVQRDAVFHMTMTDTGRGPPPLLGAAALSGRAAALSRAILLALPVLLTADFLYAILVGGHGTALDVHNEFWPAARRVLSGQSPYLLGAHDVAAGVAFPYPPVTAVAFVPLALLPRGLA